MYEGRIEKVGIRDIDFYIINKNKKLKQAYMFWRNMLIRSYNYEWKIKHPSYSDCSVCKEWKYYSNFLSWYNSSYYEAEGQRMELDKDILFKGNKTYSPETCVFVPHFINTLFTKGESKRGQYLIGVSYSKRYQTFHSSMGRYGKRKHLGSFKSETDAFDSYKINKEQYIKEVADLYKHLIPEKLYEALYEYVVDYTD